MLTASIRCAARAGRVAVLIVTICFCLPMVLMASLVILYLPLFIIPSVGGVCGALA